jgi:hypothetical protein
MKGMFYNCVSLTSIRDLSTWKFNKFYNAALDLSRKMPFLQYMLNDFKKRISYKKRIFFDSTSKSFLSSMVEDGTMINITEMFHNDLSLIYEPKLISNN